MNQLNNGADLNQQQLNQSTPSNHISLQQSHQLIVNAQTQQQQHALYNGQHVLNSLTANEKSRSSIDLRSALSNLNEMTQDLKKSTSRNRMPSPNQHLKSTNHSPINRHQPMQQRQQQPSYQQYNGSYVDFHCLNSTANNIPIQTRSQVNLPHYASQQSTNDQHFVHKTQHSSHHNRINPYYLSIPESNWRRTNSDSALHQSTIQYCEQQSQPQLVNQQQLNAQQQQQQQQQQQMYNQPPPPQNQFYDLQQQQQRQKALAQQDLNKTNIHETDVAGNNNNLMDPGKQQQVQQSNLHNSQQATIMYSPTNLTKTDLNSNRTPITAGTPGAPVISINYQNQNNFSSSMNSNANGNSSTMYTSAIINQNVQCTPTNYVNQSTSSTAYAITQTNGKRPKSCDTGQQENSNNQQFNRTLISNQGNLPNRGGGGNQLPTLQFQSSSQNNINQLNDQTIFSNLNSNHNLDQSTHHSSAIHVNTVSTNPNSSSSSNFLYANSNPCSGSLPDLSLFNHQTAPLVVPLDQEDALSSGLNSNDNSNNSNQSSGSYQFTTNQFSGIASSSMPNQSSVLNYRAVTAGNNFVQYNCSNPNSSNSNSPLHQNAYNHLTSQQQQQQPIANVGRTSNINFINKIQDNKFINQLTNNQLASQLHNHHISSPVRPSSNESAEDSGVIFNQLAGNVSKIDVCSFC